MVVDAKISPCQLLPESDHWSWLIALEMAGWVLVVRWLSDGGDGDNKWLEGSTSDAVDVIRFL